MYEIDSKNARIGLRYSADAYGNLSKCKYLLAHHFWLRYI